MSAELRMEFLIHISLDLKEKKIGLKNLIMQSHALLKYYFYFLEFLFYN